MAGVQGGTHPKVREPRHSERGTQSTGETEMGTGGRRSMAGHSIRARHHGWRRAPRPPQPLGLGLLRQLGGAGRALAFCTWRANTSRICDSEKRWGRVAGSMPFWFIFPARRRAARAISLHRPCGSHGRGRLLGALGLDRNLAVHQQARLLQIVHESLGALAAVSKCSQKARCSSSSRSAGRRRTSLAIGILGDRAGGRVEASDSSSVSGFSLASRNG